MTNRRNWTWIPPSSPSSSSAAELPELAAACPTCDAAAGDPCLTGSGKVKDDTHKARRDAFAELDDDGGDTE